MKRLLPLLLGLMVGLILLMPARLLLPAPPLAAASVEGTVWRTRLTDAALGGARLGDVQLALQLSGLMKGRAQWAATGGLTGTLWRSLSGTGVEGLSGQLTGMPLAGVPAASIGLTAVDVALDGHGRCQSAGGQIQLQLRTALAGQTSLSGAPRCDGSALAVPMASSDGRVRLDLAITGSGWTTRLVVAGVGPGDAAVLTSAGFRAENGALVSVGDGRW
jgi:general secretion pathway protein N